MAAHDFKLIRPLTITGSILTSSDIPEAVAATWSSGTTYILGDRAGAAPVDGAAQLVYESLQGGNLNHALADDGVWWRLVGSVYPAYGAGVTYAINEIASDLTNHLLYKSLANGNIGNALTDATKWESQGATNRWKMLDAKYQTQSTNEDAIVTTLTPVQVVTAVAVLNAEGTSATLTQSDTGYSETVSLIEHDVSTWWEYFTEIPTLVSDAVFTDIPPIYNKTLTLTVANAGATAKIGVLIVGTYRELGATQWDANRSINDYSTVTEATNGDISLTQGAFSKRLNVEFKVQPGMESSVTKTLEDYRAIPLVFVGSEDYAMSIIYGFLGSWAVPISNTGRNAYAEIKGLT